MTSTTSAEDMNSIAFNISREHHHVKIANTVNRFKNMLSDLDGVHPKRNHIGILAAPIKAAVWQDYRKVSTTNNQRGTYTPRRSYPYNGNHQRSQYGQHVRDAQQDMPRYATPPLGNPGQRTSSSPMTHYKPPQAVQGPEHLQSYRDPKASIPDSYQHSFPVAGNQQPTESAGPSTWGPHQSNGTTPKLPTDEPRQHQSPTLGQMSVVKAFIDLLKSSL